MLINAYDTTVGKSFKVKDDVENIIRTLHTARNLKRTNKDGVFVLDFETTVDIQVFAFPITMQTNTRQTITVYDERPFRNKGNNAIVNSNELVIQKLAAYLQHDVAEGNVTPLKNCRLIAAKAFSETLGGILVRKAALTIQEGLTLKILLAYYFIGLEEENGTDLELVGTNVIRSINGGEKGVILNVIDDLPRMALLEDILVAIRKNPVLFKLKSLDMKDFMFLISTMTFSALGGRLVIAAAEAPCLFTAFVYGAVRFKAYSKTHLGVALDPKYNKDIVEAFSKQIDYNYDLNG